MQATDRTHGIGAALKALRLSRGLRQKDVATATGLSRPAIANIEAGNQVLTSDTLPAIAKALGYEVRVSFVLPRLTNVDQQDNFS